MKRNWSASPPVPIPAISQAQPASISPSASSTRPISATAMKGATPAAAEIACNRQAKSSVFRSGKTSRLTDDGCSSAEGNSPSNPTAAGESEAPPAPAMTDCPV